jgi:class 3 adenylate cyclase
MPRRYEWRREWEMAAPPERVWSLIADTPRLNEAAGLPKYTLEETPLPDGRVQRMAKARLYGIPLSWEERPYEWVAGRSFSQRRRFPSGPLATFGPDVRLEPSGAGSRVSFTLTAEPANFLGHLLLAAGLLRIGGAKISRITDEIAKFLAGEAPRAYVPPAPSLASGARARVAAIVSALEQAGHTLAGRLGAHVLEAAEIDAERIRPRALARQWGAPDRETIALCLAATRAGLLGMRWELLCPRCRGAKAAALGLDALPRGAHCPSCNIDYDRDFSRNVEVVFRPAATIRPIGAGGYCLASPMATPHVVVQQILGPGETRRLEVTLPPGAYRLRTLEPGDEVALHHDGGALPEIAIAESGIQLGPLGSGLALHNRGAAERTLVIEERAWLRDALTAHEITTLQAFRDIFGSEVLRPGDDVEIDQVTLMFTDLKGSTALYARIGDARAYQIVREHYAFLTRAIRAHDGAIVKTIGDAVMAAFADPADAARAALAVQREITDFNRASGMAGLVIKLGLHAGPCIAVTLNDRLDYFGSTVNLAARLQGQSEGGDIVLSERLAGDPAVAAILGGYQQLRETALVKGFAEPVAFRRIAFPASADAA